MTCPKCLTGLLVDDDAYDLLAEGWARMYRCICCGNRVDATILANRRNPLPDLTKNRKIANVAGLRMEVKR